MGKGTEIQPEGLRTPVAWASSPRNPGQEDPATLSLRISGQSPRIGGCGEAECAVRGVVDGKHYRYIRYTDDGAQAELYNLDSDPWEARNLLDSQGQPSPAHAGAFSTLSAAIPSEYAPPVSSVGFKVDSTCLLSPDGLLSRNCGCGTYGGGGLSPDVMYAFPNTAANTYDPAQTLLTPTVGIKGMYSWVHGDIDDSDTCGASLTGRILSLPITLFAGHEVRNVAVTLSWVEGDYLDLEVLEDDICWKGGWSSPQVTLDELNNSLTFTADHNRVRDGKKGICEILMRISLVDGAWESGGNGTTFTLSGTYQREVHVDPAPVLGVLAQSRCMNYTPIAPERNMAYAVPEPNLYAVIARHEAMKHSVFGWPCETEDITELDASNAGIAEPDEEEDYEALDGIAMLENLEVLTLNGNDGIQKLRALNDPVSPPLRELYLSGCTNIVRNGGPIRKLHCLEILDMSGCLGTAALRFTSLNATLYHEEADTYLYRLRDLRLSGCEYLTDIEVLQCLPALEYVDLSDCTGIDSLDCLVENPDFGTGDTLKIHLDDWSAALIADIECLRAHGVTVDANCQNCFGSSCTGHVSNCAGTCETRSDQCLD